MAFHKTRGFHTFKFLGDLFHIWHVSWWFVWQVFYNLFVNFLTSFLTRFFMDLLKSCWNIFLDSLDFLDLYIYFFEWIPKKLNFLFKKKYNFTVAKAFLFHFRKVGIIMSGDYYWLSKYCHLIVWSFMPKHCVCNS